MQHTYYFFSHTCFTRRYQYPGETVVGPRRDGSKERVRTRNPVQFSSSSKCFHGLTLWPFHMLMVHQRSLCNTRLGGLRSTHADGLAMLPDTIPTNNPQEEGFGFQDYRVGSIFFTHPSLIGSFAYTPCLAHRTYSTNCGQQSLFHKLCLVLQSRMSPCAQTYFCE